MEFSERLSLIADRLAEKGLPFTRFNVHREHLLLFLEATGCKNPETMLALAEGISCQP